MGRKDQIPFRRPTRIVLLLLFSALVIYVAYTPFLCWIGDRIVTADPLAKADAIVVLNSDIEYYPRLIEAAERYRQGLAPKIVINGNRKNEAIRMLEQKGFSRCCHWCEERLRVLTICGVPRANVICISAEDAYDTGSEAIAVGNELIRLGIHSVIIATSKYHSLRARYIWRQAFAHRLAIQATPAESDPYDPHGWWRSGKQIRWVMAEYGAWLFHAWKRINPSDEGNQPRGAIDRVPKEETGT